MDSGFNRAYSMIVWGMPFKDPEKRKAYFLEYQKTWLASRRKEWIESKGGECAQCGATDRLEIDHINPEEKSVNVGQIWSRRAEIRDKELAKCQVLCHDCHAEKTSGMYAGPRHGTHYNYVHFGCRCNECRAAHAKLARQYRESKKGLK